MFILPVLRQYIVALVLPPGALEQQRMLAISLDAFSIPSHHPCRYILLSIYISICLLCFCGSYCGLCQPFVACQPPPSTTVPLCRTTALRSTGMDPATTAPFATPTRLVRALLAGIFVCIIGIHLCAYTPNCPGHCHPLPSPCLPAAKQVDAL
jgi:hypothetical protein